MAGVVASKVRKQRSALKADANRDAETQNKYLNVGNVYFLRLFWIRFLGIFNCFLLTWNGSGEGEGSEGPRAKFIKTFLNPQDLRILYFKYFTKMDQIHLNFFHQYIMQTTSFSPRKVQCFQVENLTSNLIQDRLLHLSGPFTPHRVIG